MSEPVPLEHADVYSEDGYYAVIPEWVLDANISAQAVRLYAVLRRYADQRTLFAHPSRKTLAGRLHVKDEKVVDRALEDLQRISAVTIVPRWRNEAGEITYSPAATTASAPRTATGCTGPLTRRSREGVGAFRPPPPGASAPRVGAFPPPGWGLKRERNHSHRTTAMWTTKLTSLSPLTKATRARERARRRRAPASPTWTRRRPGRPARPPNWAAPATRR